MLHTKSLPLTKRARDLELLEATGLVPVVALYGGIYTSTNAGRDLDADNRQDRTVAIIASSRMERNRPWFNPFRITDLP